MPHFEPQSLDKVLLCPLCGYDMIPAMKFPCTHRICDDCYVCLAIDDCPTCTQPGIAVPDPLFDLLVRRFQRERKYKCMRCKAMIQSEDHIGKHCCTRMNYEIIPPKPPSTIRDVVKEIAQAVQVYGENIFQNISGYGRTTTWKVDEQGKLYTYVQLFDPTLTNYRIFLSENNMCGESVTVETKPEVVFIYAKPDPMNIGKFEAEVAHPKSWEDCDNGCNNSIANCLIQDPQNLEQCLKYLENENMMEVSHQELENLDQSIIKKLLHIFRIDLHIFKIKKQEYPNYYEWFYQPMSFEEWEQNVLSNSSKFPRGVKIAIDRNPILKNYISGVISFVRLNPFIFNDNLQSEQLSS